MDQSMVNWLLAGFSGLIGFLVNSVWNAVRDLQTADTQLAKQLSEIETLVAGDYTRKEDFDRSMEKLYRKLDDINDKMWNRRSTDHD